jgi:WXG100 family type VII secretion target
VAKEKSLSALKVTPDQLSAMSSAIGSVSAEVRGQHQRLTGQLRPLFGADWSGAASAQFSSLYEQFDQHARGMSDALDAIGAVLGRAAQTYAEAEQRIAASFR